MSHSFLSILYALKDVMLQYRSIGYIYIYIEYCIYKVGVADMDLGLKFDIFVYLKTLKANLSVSSFKYLRKDIC